MAFYFHKEGLLYLYDVYSPKYPLADMVQTIIRLDEVARTVSLITYMYLSTSDIIMNSLAPQCHWMYITHAIWCTYMYMYGEKKCTVTTWLRNMPALYAQYHVLLSSVNMHNAYGSGALDSSSEHANLLLNYSVNWKFYKPFNQY